MKDINIAAVVVTYNRKELLKKCIECLLKQEHAQCDIIIIDNASTDATGEMVAKIESDRIKYHNTGANLGGAGGFNFGVRKAVECGYDYLWIMDDDCMVHSDSLFELIRADKELGGNYGFLSSVVKYKDGNICNMNIQKSSLVKKVRDFEKDYTKIIFASFVSLFVKAKVVREVGLPISDFFIWADDLEYTRRISRIYPCFLIGKSVVIHECANNNGSNIAAENGDRLKWYNYSYRNEVHVYRREGIKGFFYQAARIIFHILNIIFRSKRKRTQKIKIIMKSTAKGFSFKPKIEMLKD